MLQGLILYVSSKSILHFYLFKKYFTSTCTHLLLLESVFLCFLDETQKVIEFACVNCYSCLERSDLLHRTSHSHMCVCLRMRVCVYTRTYI